MTVNGAYFICLQYGSEIFPTVIRGQGVALCEILGGVAIFLSPTVVYLARISPVLPLLILGLCSIIGALATFFLPETAGQQLPQTLSDGETFGLDQSRWDVVSKQQYQLFCCNNVVIPKHLQMNYSDQLFPVSIRLMALCLQMK